MSDKIDYRDELNKMRQEFQVQQKIPCSQEENKQFVVLLQAGDQLPDGVFPYLENERDNTEFYRFQCHDFTAAELTEYLTYKNLQLISTIRNCLVFFTVLTIASLALALFGISSI